ncbi:MAG: DUF7260 family protein [Halanaeroarchaeum sp.]
MIEWPRKPSEIRNVLDSAVQTIETERRRTNDERQAFVAFERRVRDIEVEGSTGAGRWLTDDRSVADTGGRALAQVRDAYEETVMSTPHYVEEYGDTYAESLVEEFDVTVTDALVNGDRLNRQVRRVLFAAIEKSKEKRRSFLSALDREAASVRDARNSLRPVLDRLDEFQPRAAMNRSSTESDATELPIADYVERVETVTETRQDTLFALRHGGWQPPDAPDAAHYFYRELAVDYPVLWATAETSDWIEILKTHRRRRFEAP